MSEQINPENYKSENGVVYVLPIDPKYGHNFAIGIADSFSYICSVLKVDANTTVNMKMFPSTPDLKLQANLKLINELDGEITRYVKFTDDGNELIGIIKEYTQLNNRAELIES